MLEEVRRKNQTYNNNLHKAQVWSNENKKQANLKQRSVEKKRERKKLEISTHTRMIQTQVDF